jgi:hypothetical protein
MIDNGLPVRMTVADEVRSDSDPAIEYCSTSDNDWPQSGGRCGCRRYGVLAMPPLFFCRAFIPAQVDTSHELLLGPEEAQMGSK